MRGGTTMKISVFMACLVLLMVSISCSLLNKTTARPTSPVSTIVVFEDFEGDSYENWTIEGEAFGTKPHTGTSPKQQPVAGFMGKGLINTYFPDDTPRGKLVSKSFLIEKPFIGFLIGGGDHPGETCINLVVNESIARTKNGINSEYLKPAVWDVSDLIGGRARFEIIDTHSGGWGHINVDHIIFSDSRDDIEASLIGYKQMLMAGEFQKIYDPSVGEKEQWYINDHTFVYGPDDNWHMFGITHAEPANPGDEDNFAHAVSPKLMAQTWIKLPFALSVDWDSWKEVHLWAPHVIKHQDTYYMFYCAGDPDPTTYKIHLATSKDLHTWTRHPANPMVRDGYHARDPFILKNGNVFIMYYTATDPVAEGNHVVACRTSTDLIHWNERHICFRDPSIGTWGGPTESPFVVRRGGYYYMFVGPRGGYIGTTVFRSTDPFKWNLSDQVGHIESHALEVIRDKDGAWYVSHCGWGQGGVYLAPLTWLDGLDDMETSLLPPR